MKNTVLKIFVPLIPFVRTKARENARTLIDTTDTIVKRSVNQNDCVKKYKKISTQYSKGKLGIVDINIFAAGEENAIRRAKKLNSPNNPSTTVYKLIEAIREV
jgi:hypothetical protein